MSEAELIFTALAELSTRQIAETMCADGMQENKTASKAGDGIAKDARLKLEKKTGKKVVTASNYLERTTHNTLENEKRVGKMGADSASPKIAQKGRRKKI